MEKLHIKKLELQNYLNNLVLLPVWAEHLFCPFLAVWRVCRVFPLFHIVGGKISGLVSAVPPIVEHRRYRGCFGNEKRKSSRRTSASHTSAPEGVVVQTPGRAFLTANSAPALSSTRPLTDGYTGPK